MFSAIRELGGSLRWQFSQGIGSLFTRFNRLCKAVFLHGISQNSLLGVKLQLISNLKFKKPFPNLLRIPREIFKPEVRDIRKDSQLQMFLSL